MFNKNVIYSISLAVLLGVAGRIQAQSFSIDPTQDGHVCNDPQYGPSQAYNSNGIHIRNASPRRRVGYFMYDLSTIRRPGRVFTNVSLSILGYDPGDIVVYGVKEDLDNAFSALQFNALTWNTVPAGVPNNPAPAVDSSVQLDLADLVGPLSRFRAPARGTRVSTDPNQALADFLSSDTDGIVVLVFAPAAEGANGIIRSIEYADGAARLQGDVGGVPTGAGEPVPADKATEAPHDVALGWISGAYAASHNVYFGTTFEDVNAASTTNPLGVLLSQGQGTNTYDPVGLIEYSKTYYWRVDEVNAPPDSTLFKGEVWSFTVEPFAYPITTPITASASSSNSILTAPAKTIDGSGLTNDQHSTSGTDMWLSNAAGPKPPWIQYEFDRVYKLYQMWVWNSNQLLEPDLGLGAKEVTIEVSTDGTSWTALTGVSEFAQATATTDYVHNTTVDLGGALAKYVKLTIQSNWGGVKSSGLSEVRFFYLPAKAFGPTPASTATDVALDGVLNWRPGREVARHEVYFSTDPNALSKIGTVTEHRYPLGSLGVEYDKTYYWKVNEVNEAANPTTWEGDTWSFTTVGYAVVDDFESYNDLCSKIFYAWVDKNGYNAPAECGGAGAPGNGSGATVGNDSAPYAERTIVHSGSQSMPMPFDNRMNPYYSETQREWTTPQAWNTGGANTLRVYFQGIAPAFLETSPGNIVMSGTGTDIFGTSDQGRFAYKSLTGDGSIVARVDSLANTNAWAKAGVMIRETLNAGSSWAYIVYGGTNGVHFQARLTTDVSATSDTSLASLPTSQTGARAPVWVKVERKGNQFNGYYATDAAGSAWTPMAWNPQTITMTSTVYIGLAVTSHAANVACGARFSSVSTQGNVTGSWELADLLVTQPTSGNSPETFYVAVKDSAGKMKVVSHPDPVAMASGAWEEWNIPLSQFTFAGINLGQVKQMIVGVGDRNAPKAGNAGKVYIDDIRLTRVVTP